MNDKKKVLDRINIDTDIFMTSFDRASRILLEQKDILEKKGWSSIHLKMEYYNEGAELVAMGMRLETDSEYNNRKEKELKELKKAENRLEREKKKYEELRKKFEVHDNV